MVLLISENTDKSMFRISEWLKFYNTEYIIIFEDSCVNIKYIDFSGEDVEIDGRKIKFSDITSYYWRRADVYFHWDINSNSQISAENEFYHAEYYTLQDFFYFLISKKRGLGHRFESNNLNKLVALYTAKKVGLLIPNSMVIENKTQLKAFLCNNKNVFTKPMYNLKLFKKNGKEFTFFNKPYGPDSFQYDDEDFYHSFVQTYIEKKYELRVFVFKTKVFAMAIFSQRNEKTMFDYRDSSVLVPFTPYKMPALMEKRILLFMKEMNLDTGSIDFIVDSRGDYYFLEINAVGIFDMVSSPCHYHIEKEIAEYLTQN